MVSWEMGVDMEAVEMPMTLEDEGVPRKLQMASAVLISIISDPQTGAEVVPEEEAEFGTLTMTLLLLSMVNLKTS